MSKKAKKLLKSLRAFKFELQNHPTPPVTTTPTYEEPERIQLPITLYYYPGTEEYSLEAKTWRHEFNVNQMKGELLDTCSAIFILSEGNLIADECSWLYSVNQILKTFDEARIEQKNHSQAML